MILFRHCSIKIIKSCHLVMIFWLNSVYVCELTGLYVRVCMWAHGLYVRVCMWAHGAVCTCMYVSPRGCMYVYVCEPTGLYVRVCMWAHGAVCTCMHVSPRGCMYVYVFFCFCILLFISVTRAYIQLNTYTYFSAFAPSLTGLISHYKSDYCKQVKIKK